jgi:hypothetical protein
MDFQLKGTPTVEKIFCVTLFSPPLQDKCRPKSRAGAGRIRKAGGPPQARGRACVAVIVY